MPQMGLDIDPNYVVWCAFENADHTAEDYELSAELETQSVVNDLDEKSTAAVLKIRLRCKKHSSNPVGLDHGH